MPLPDSAAWRLAFTLGWRDLRGTGRRFAVLIAALTLGVAIIAAVGLLNGGVDAALERDSRVLLGGDVELEQVNQPIADEELAALAPEGTRVSRIVRTTTLAHAEDGRSVAVNLKAVDDLHPLLGRVRLRPDRPLAEALAENGAVVEETLLARLGLAVGDTMRIGDATVRITARIVREPDRVGGFLGLGPRVIVADETLAVAGVLLPGALARYEYRLLLPPGWNGDEFVAELRRAWPDALWQARGPRGVEPGVTRVTDRLGTFLMLAGLTALLTGGLGIALTIETHLAQRTATIATLKGLGASGTQIFRIYLCQVLIVAGAGVTAGLAVGLLLPLMVRLLPDGLLPVTPALGVQLVPLARAAVAGIATALAFALWPLAIARETSAAGLFRALVAPPRRWPRRRYLVMLGLAVLALALVAIVGVPQPRIGAWFALTALAASVLLWGLTRLILRLARRLGHRGGFALRLAIASLHHPGASAPRVIIALGAGVTVLVAIAVLAANLRQEIAGRLPTDAPSLFFIDIQPQQRQTLARLVAATPGGRLLQELPSLRARVVRIDGQPVEAVQVAPEVAWTVRRDRGLTYAATLPPGSELAAGSWWPADHAGPPLVSLDEEVAQGYRVGIGDTLTFNVLGRSIEARIANLRREIDWSKGRLDFLFVLDPHTLAGAPHTFVASADVRAEAEAELLNRLAAELPNVTPISLRDVVDRLGEALGRIELAVNLVAGVTLGGGILALLGGVLAARQRQRYETVILKILGAQRLMLLKAFLLEYLVVGVAVALVGGLLGSLAAWLVVTQVMELAWTPAPRGLATVLLAAILTTMTVGAASLARLLALPVAPALRSG